jgi:tRNA (guanosine-2'-O-)-methyltransferase
MMAAKVDERFIMRDHLPRTVPARDSVSPRRFPAFRLPPGSPSGPRPLSPSMSSEESLEPDPTSICAALAPLLLDERRTRIDAAVAARLGGLRVVIENLHDPHNGAAVLRSAEAFGIQRVDVIESHKPFRYSPTVTQGCEKWLDVVRHRSLEAAVAVLRRDGFVIYAAVPGVEASVDDLNFSRPAAVMVGNEHEGLTGAAIDAADKCFSIPMAGMTASLNLSVATALIASRAAALRRRALRAEGDLDARQQVALRARFYAASVRGADAVVARYRDAGG